MKKFQPSSLLFCGILCGIFCVLFSGIRNADAQTANTQDAAFPLSQRTAKTSPKWVTEGVIYQINPRAFTPEGTLKAAEAKLPDLAKLGVSIVYLCPVFVADDDMDQRYWSPRQKASKMESPLNPYRMKDYYHVDPEYGTDSDLKSYVETAHSLGMRVMLDMVYLHCGPTAVFIKEHPDFVKHDKDGNIVNAAWSFPGLNFQCQELREYLFANMEQWVRDYGVDGFRMDVGDGIELKFWEEARERLEKIRPDVGMLSEGTRKEDQLKAFDLDYGFPVSSAMRRVYDQNAPAREIRSIKESFRAARPIGGDRMIHYIDNHDISNDDYANRIEKRWGEEGVNAMLAMIFTLDGTPMLYCGQEVCDKNRHSIFGSKFNCKVDWANASSDEASRRLALIRRLADTRKARPELTAGSLVWLENSVDADVLSYLRTLDGKQTLVVINVRPRTVPTDVTLPDGSKRHFDLKNYEFVIKSN